MSGGMQRAYLFTCETGACHGRMVIPGADSRTARTTAADAGWNFEGPDGATCPACANRQPVGPQFCTVCNGEVRFVRRADRCVNCGTRQPDLFPQDAL